ncbi:hypothetical secreted protein [Synechococcus phage S-CRM01]|uniref:hypothetical secreted protein n=1 Tax=Synechococcus phage S-CRM01 TaxID=1026955 RepID=UPI000209E338|nr:hypothetical secreted protein [Synechococcus phage S-CRM01]AEC53245.1 hypothetical secreted protein [Synechococcus phage S-CRM01]
MSFILGRYGNTPPPIFPPDLFIAHMTGLDGSVLFPDSSIYGLVGTPSGGAEITNDQLLFGQNSALFNGVDSLVNFPDSAQLDINTIDEWTLQCWVYCNSFSSNMTIISKGNSFPGSGEGWGLECGLAGTFLDFYIGDEYYGDNISSLGPLSGVWNHVEVTELNSVITLFFNGNLVAYSPAFPSSSHVGDMLIGRDLDSNYPFDGHIREVVISPRSIHGGILDGLTNSEKDALAALGPIFTPPTAPWPDP